MPIPAATLQPGRSNISISTGDPVNGLNTFLHNWDIPAELITEDAIELDYQILGPSVSAPSFVALSADRLSLQVNFTQAGADQVRIQARHVHSIDM